MAEELALEQRLGKAAAGHFHEAALPATGTVDLAGEERLASAALAGHEHGGGSRSDLTGDAEGTGHRRMRAEQR